MNLTDKTKAEFDEWLDNKKHSIIYDIGERQPDIIDLNEYFYQLPLSMKIGTLILYFDSVGIFIGVYPIDVFENRCDGYGYEIVQYKKETIDEDTLLSREQAWTQAVESADKIRNEQLK